MALPGLPELFPNFCGRKDCQLSSVRDATSTEIGDSSVFVALGGGHLPEMCLSPCGYIINCTKKISWAGGKFSPYSLSDVESSGHQRSFVFCCIG